MPDEVSQFAIAGVDNSNIKAKKARSMVGKSKKPLGLLGRKSERSTMHSPIITTPVDQMAF